MYCFTHCQQHVNLSESIPAILLVKEENKEKNKEKNGNSERSVLKDSSTLLRPQEQIETSAPSIVNVSVKEKRKREREDTFKRNC